MANVVVRYNNGTFEAPEGTWDSQIGDTHELSNDFAAAGAASCKITPPAVLDPFTEASWGHAMNLGEFPVGAVGEETEIRLKLRVTAGVPDDMFFFIVGLGGFTDVQGITTVVRAEDAKAGFVDLVANFAAGNAYGAPLRTTAFLITVRNMAAFIATHPSTLAAYPGLSAYDNDVAWPGAEVIYIDVYEAEPKAIPALPDPSGQSVGDLLYHKENIFILTATTRAGTESHEINEPINWDKILINISLDQTLFMYKFEFTDKDITLAFDDASGRSVLKEVYKDYGEDGVAYLSFGLVDRTDPDNVVLEILFEMQVAFDTWEEDEAVARVGLERRSMNDLFRSRYDMKTSLASEGTIDNQAAALTALSLKDLWLHPFRVLLSSKFLYNAIVNIADDIVWASGNVPGFATILDNVPPFKNCANNIPDLQDPIAPSGQLIYANLGSGQIVRRLAFDVDVLVTLDFPDNSPGGNYGSNLLLYKKNFLDGSDIPVNPPVDGETFADDAKNHGALAGSFDVAYNVAGGVILQPGEAVFIRLIVETQGADMSGVYRLPDSWQMTVTDNSNAAPTITKTYRIFEAVDRQIELITGQAGRLKSNLLGRTDLGYAANGCGSHHLLFSGEMARGLLNSSTLAAKDWVNVFNALYCTGLAMERNDAGEEFLRFEELSYFFPDVELLNLPIVSSYKKESASEYIYNELRFAFHRYPQEGQGASRQEVMSEIKYSTPVKQSKNKLEVLVEMLMSSSYIRGTQEQIFKEKGSKAESCLPSNPASSYETDKELFLVSHTDGDPAGPFGPFAMTFDADEKTLSISDAWKVPLIPGDVITITDTASNNTDYTVANIEVMTPPVGEVVIYLVETPVNEGPVNGSITLPADRFLARTMEDDFDLVTGVDYPEGLYNLEHHLKRIFYRWSHFFAAGLTKKDGDELLLFLDGKLNNALTTQTVGGYTCSANDNLADPALYNYTDNKNERVDTLRSPLWTSNIIRLKAKLTWNTINEIRKAFEGRHPDDKNYGYFSWTNPDGELEKGRLKDMRYDAATQMSTFTFIEKAP